MNAPQAPANLEPLLLEKRSPDGVVTLTLNRPAQFNSLSEEMLAALQAAFDRIGADQTARVIVVAAAGKAFCAGHDLKQMKANPRQDYYEKLFADCAGLMLTISRVPQPVIARVHGIATAAGCQLVATCDLAVAVDSARFGVNGIDVGLFCASPSVALARNVGRKQAFEMLVTGEFIDAATAKARGLVNRVVAADQLDAEVKRLADAIVAKPGLAIGMGKGLFYRQLEMGIDAAYQLAGQTMACNMIDEVAQEGVAAFMEKRKPHWAGSR
ncbi:MAG: enoyl-CoA hydratase [Burkholderiales bacterium]|jgi:enoyl-CoA hydratase/carnithine racemase|nr:enoyl-CoA hydratase [Burkholderiales bacterium]